MPDTSTDDACLVAERLRKSIASKPFAITHESESKIDVTVSIGIATLSPRLSTSATLIEAADRALYQSKHEGRNRVTPADDASEAA